LEKVVRTSLIACTQPIQMRVEELISGVRATWLATFTERTWVNWTA
jgi:Cu/Ag efflux pump CusA